eukprot:scaffold625_cov420-Prasinococcus_capsulatus_cf.AAC.2
MSALNSVTDWLPGVAMGQQTQGIGFPGYQYTSYLYTDTENKFRDRSASRRMVARKLGSEARVVRVSTVSSLVPVHLPVGAWGSNSVPAGNADRLLDPDETSPRSSWGKVGKEFRWDVVHLGKGDRAAGAGASGIAAKIGRQADAGNNRGAAGGGMEEGRVPGPSDGRLPLAPRGPAASDGAQLHARHPASQDG